MMKKTFNWFVIILFFLAVGALVFLNFKNNNFFEMNLYQILSLSFVVIVSYYLTQKKLDSREQREVINELITEIINCTFELTLDALQSEKSKLFMMELRNIENRLSLLEKTSKMYDTEAEIEYLKSQHKNIHDLVSTHIGDNVTLNNIFVDIERDADNIRNKCKEIQFKLYFN